MKAELTERILKQWVNKPSPELNSLIAISFRAGQDDATRDFLKYAQTRELDKRFEELKQVGRREVVEWISDYLKECHRLMGDCTVLITQDDIGIWQAKLKEWGIDEKV